MPRFFLETIGGESAQIAGADAKHIAKVLRMEPGKEIVVSDTRGTDYLCRITEVSAELVKVDVVGSKPCPNECRVPIRLFQAMPKGDKLEHIVQKAVELGAVEITPVMTSRCISRPSNKALEKRLVRLQRIAYEAAKQCGRGVIPRVRPLVSYEDALEKMTESALSLMLYEEGDTLLRDVLPQEPRSISLLVGSEGGFSAAEAQLAREKGIAIAGLGGRILRCETAPLCALSALLYHLGEF